MHPICSEYWGALYKSSSRDRTLSKVDREGIITTLITNQVIDQPGRYYFRIVVDNMKGWEQEYAHDMDIGLAYTKYDFSCCWLRGLNPATYLSQVCQICGFQLCCFGRIAVIVFPVQQCMCQRSMFAPSSALLTWTVCLCSLICDPVVRSKSFSTTALASAFFSPPWYGFCSRSPRFCSL